MSVMNRRQAIAAGSAAVIAGAAPRAAWGRTDADVIVIGAGLAGLYAATLLEAQGAHVILIEGNTRIGGRMHTLDRLPGKPEAGGVQVGSGYKRLIALAKKHNIPLHPGPMVERNALYRIGDTSVAMADWAQSAANRLAPHERAIPPAALGAFYGTRMASLPDAEAWMEPDAAKLDIPYSAALAAAGASAEAIRLIGANLNGNSIHTLSAINLARTAAIFRSSPGPILVISGGSQRLPEAMAGTLKAPPRLGQVVTAISESNAGAEVTLAGGKTLSARNVICTIPFAALRHIAINGLIGRDIAGMIGELPYTHASFAYLSASEPFWKTDGFPETIWSDDPLLGRVFILGEQPPMLKVWLSGAAADHLDRMPADAAAAAIISRIEAARPSARGKLRLVRLHSWQKNPMARGIYHHIAPGQTAALAASARHKGARLHFAGEHLAQSGSGMEGALESGERAALTILGKI